MSKRVLLIGFCAVMIVTAAVMFIIALGFDAKSVETAMPGSRFFPFITLAMIALFSLAIIVQNAKRGGDEERIEMTRAEALRVLAVGASAFVAYALWDRLGFLPIAGFLIVVIGVTLRLRSIWGYLILAAIGAALFFTLRSLGVPLD